MLIAGALEEAEALHSLGLPPEAPVLKAIGVKELIAYLKGEGDLDGAVVAAKASTRRYAKRQATWFRHQFRADYEIYTKYSEALLQKLFPKIRHFLLT